MSRGAKEGDAAAAATCPWLREGPFHHHQCAAAQAPPLRVQPRPRNFFPSINFGRVRGFFLKDKHFSLQPPVATVLAQIACFENELPQGSPCSPVISNLIGHVLDGRLARFAKTHKCTYSRYADDITFSTSRKDFPPEIGVLFVRRRMAGR